MLNITQFILDDSGATAFEYGLIIGIVTLIAFGSIAFFYEELNNLFGRWGDWFADPKS